MEKIEIKIHGARGSITTPSRGGSSKEKYGTETTSFELRKDNYSVLIDAGSGIRQADLKSLLQRDVTLLFTHAHDDHMVGLGFFPFVYMPQANLKVKASPEHMHALQRYYNKDNGIFPVDIETMMPGIKDKQTFAAFQPLSIDSMVLTPVPLKHPQNSYGYIVETAEKKIALLWDVEHQKELNRIGTGIDKTLINYMEGSDLVIMDGQFTSTEYDPSQFGLKGMAKAGFGHNSDEKALKLAERAGVKYVVLTHHDPSHDDNFLDKRLEELQAKFPHICVDYAKEGSNIII